MRILGIDPGTRITGYGVIEQLDRKISTLDYGCIRPPPKLTLSERYLILFESIEALIDKYRPDALSVESQFVLKNPQSAIKLGMAKGMAILAAAKRSIEIFEYPPKRAKLAITGMGQASKWQVQKMIQSLLSLPSLPEPEDAADALALALCHLQTEKRNQITCMNRSGAS